MRVTGGRLGGRVLQAPRGLETRPTSDRVRESLFQVLGDLSGARVVDLYAGSGALGIEALSRGALSVTFVEARRAAAKALAQNLRSLGLEGVSRVLVLPVERAGVALAAEGPFDLLLADPPWADVPGALRELARLLRHLTLHAEARVVLEHSAREPLLVPPDFPLETDWTRTWGDTAVSQLSAKTLGNASD
jgi:16S rRNA (guanine966-N2)-methyltransferase